jgi:hypothetical protein
MPSQSLSMREVCLTASECIEQEETPQVTLARRSLGSGLGDCYGRGSCRGVKSRMASLAPLASQEACFIPCWIRSLCAQELEDESCLRFVGDLRLHL